LREAVAGSDPAFQAAILHSLGEMKDREALSLACELATSEHADVRVAAADALTWTGNPIYLKTIRQVIAAADEKTRADAVDALLTLNRNIAEAGGNWEIAVRTYLQLLDDYEGQYKQAALAGLGQIGDGSCVLPIVAAIENTDTRTWLVGINALRTMPGIDVTRQLAMMIETLPRETQEKLLPVLGERGSQHAVSPLKRFSQHTDPGLQQAAIVGISRSGMPEFVDQLLDLAKSENAATRELAEKGLFKIANTLIERGDRAAAGDVYGKVLAGSDKMEVRRQALEGLAENPAPDAANHLLASADDANLKPLVVPGLVAAAKHQMEKGQCNEAINLLYRAREKDLTEQLAETLRRHLAEVGVPVKLAPMYGLIPSYYLIGPFGIDDEHERWEKQLVGEPDVDLGETHSADGQSLSWKRVNAEHLNARIDLRQQLADCNQCCAYALTTIKVAEETEATLRVSMDDSPRIWVNSQLVFDKLEGRALAVDQDIVPITLQSGENTILFKIWQDRAGWEFFVRVTTPDGLPLRFVPAGKLANDQWCAQ
jgi:HEAT repeat protein